MLPPRPVLRATSLPPLPPSRMRCAVVRSIFRRSIGQLLSTSLDIPTTALLSDVRERVAGPVGPTAAGMRPARRGSSAADCGASRWTAPPATSRTHQRKQRTSAGRAAPPRRGIPAGPPACRGRVGDRGADRGMAVLRSKDPQGVAQEMWALFAVYQAIHTLIGA